MKRFCDEVRRITAPNTVKESGVAKIKALNNFIRGWCQYYQITETPSKPFSTLSTETFWGISHWLSRKYQVSIPTTLRQYKAESTLQVKSVKLIMPNEYKAKKRLVRLWHNPYTNLEKVNEEKDRIKREKLFTYDRVWMGNESSRPGWADVREEVIQLKGTTCYVCGTELHPSEVEVDHATKPRAMFKDTQEADRMKHLQPVCTSCHRAQTKVDLKVLSRVR